MYFKDINDLLDKTFELAMSMEKESSHASGFKTEYFIKKLESIRDYFYSEYLAGNIKFINDFDNLGNRSDTVRRVLSSKK